MCWRDELKIEDLRGDYAALAAVIGLANTVRYAEEFGGMPLVLPYVGEITQLDQLRSGYLDIYEITQDLELTNAVAQKLGGGQLYLPQVDNALLEVKKRYVKNHDKVSNRRQLARETKLSLSYVYRLCQEKTEVNRNRRKDGVLPGQLGLFQTEG